MAKGPPKPLNARRDCRFDHLVAAAITKGYGIVLVYRGITSEERGHEIRRGIFRCAKHRNVTGDAGPSKLVPGTDPDAMGLRQVGDEYHLHFRVWPKHRGRAQVLQKYGTDRTSWAYDPRRPKNQSDIDAWAAQGLNEKGHRVR